MTAGSRKQLAALAALTGILVAVVAAPALAAQGSPAGLAIYAAFSRVCHQQAERCWHVAGFPLAVCVRCLGLYAGALAGMLVGVRFSRVLLAVSLAALGADWAGEAVGWLGSRPPARFAIGAAAGFFLTCGLLTEPGLSITRRRWVRGEIRL